MSHDDHHPQPAKTELTQPPPATAGGIIRRLGPGLIIAASIVGSGELIATTKTGAEAGFWLLWLIIVGCVIKVFVQIEFGRFAITQGRTSLEGMNEVPGPRWRANWLVWYWVLMFSAGIGQLGGIVGSVGQSLAITLPLTGDVKRLVEVQDAQASFDREVSKSQENLAADAHGPVGQAPPAAGDEALHAARARVEALRGPRPEIPGDLRYTYDDVYWSALLTVVTAGLLFGGRYGLVQNVATVLVASFTMVTFFNLIALQSHSAWRITWDDVTLGLSFRLPPAIEGHSPLYTALATFGIIGVGASELVSYPYWCLEKGYARFTGPRSDDPQWAERARGWMRVMHWDAWCSMMIYTFATLAFYLLGAAVLSRARLIPADDQLLFTLMQMYVPVFGAWAPPIFLVGAFAVLYSTFFVASAANARMAADALAVVGVVSGREPGRGRLIRGFCVLFPVISCVVYSLSKNPVGLVLLGGLLQTIMLPMLAAAGLHFRYRRCDPRVQPGRLWDALLWISCVGLLVVGVFGAWTKLGPLLARLAAALNG